MTASTFMLLFSGAVCPWLTALLRRHQWSDDTVRVVAVVVAAAAFILGQAMDGVLSWPLTGDFFVGLAAAVGLQQTGYALYKRATPNAMDRVESIGNQPQPPDAPEGWTRV